MRAVIKYLYLKGMTAKEIFCDMKETLAESAPAFSTVAKWRAEFERGRSSCDDLPRCGRPATCVDLETVEKVNKLIMSDRRLSVCFIAASVGISTGSVHSILTENLSMNKVSARWVPRMLSDVQKADRVESSTGLLRLFNENPDNFVSRFLTVDETWLHHFDPESKLQSMTWKHACSPPPRKFRVVASARKVMATVFWDAEGTVLTDYLEHGRTITGTYYADLIGKVRAALKEKRRGKLRRGVLFHQDNAPAHTSSQALAAIRNAGFELVHHPPYSPDLAPSDFYLFPKLKEFMKGRRFADDEDVICTANGWLEEQDKQFFYNGIRALEKRWTKCISVAGDYVEK